MLESLAEIVNPATIFASALLGVLIGAFYGFELNPDLPPIFPRALLIVGWAFIATFTVLDFLGGSAPFTPAQQAGRAILWGVTCGSIPIGRFARFAITRRRQST